VVAPPHPILIEKPIIEEIIIERPIVEEIIIEPFINEVPVIVIEQPAHEEAKPNTIKIQKPDNHEELKQQRKSAEERPQKPNAQNPQPVNH